MTKEKAEAAAENVETAAEKTEAVVEESKDVKMTLETSAEVTKLVDKAMKLSAEERKAFTAAYIGKLSVLELSEQVKTLEEVFGVTAAAPMAMAVMPAGGAGGEGDVAEKSTFDVVLKEVGDKKIQVIKAVRAATNLGLKEAKALVDAAPGKLKEGLSKDEAEAVKKELEAAGAVVELQ